MRILVISNLYPPYIVGGYELGCRDVVDGLKARGHEVKVLASTYGVGKRKCDGEIYRWLQEDLGWGDHRRANFGKLLRKELNNQIAFRRLCAIFNPDVVYVWALKHVSISLAFIAQRIELPICYFISDNWLSRWEKDSWYWVWNPQPRRIISRFGRRLFRSLPSISDLFPASISLDLRNVQFASQYLKQFALQAGKQAEKTKIIHWGVDVNQYPFRKLPNNPKRLLYVGQIVQHKGVHTVVEALKLIVQEHGYKSTSLTIAGGTIVPDYEAYVRRLVASLRLENNVHFIGFIPRESVPSIYQEHDILLFPSVWDEPFSITLLEGMSSGLAVVGTATGGSGEILEDEVNALVFPKEDAKACSTQIIRLMEDPKVFERIRRNARRTVEERFRFEDMMDKIEDSLHGVVE